MLIRFNDLLLQEGIEPSRVRLLRHQTKEKGASQTPYGLRIKNISEFEDYQSVQLTKRSAWFKGPIWASFVVPSSKETLFVGLYEVLLIGKLACERCLNPLTGRPYTNPGLYDRYLCSQMRALESHIGKLKIDWGRSPKAWVQRADKQNKEIVE